MRSCQKQWELPLCLRATCIGQVILSILWSENDQISRFNKWCRNTRFTVATRSYRRVKSRWVSSCNLLDHDMHTTFTPCSPKTTFTYLFSEMPRMPSLAFPSHPNVYQAVVCIALAYVGSPASEGTWPRGVQPKGTSGEQASAASDQHACRYSRKIINRLRQR